MGFILTKVCAYNAHKDVLIAKLCLMDFLIVQFVITIMVISSAMNCRTVQPSVTQTNIGMKYIFNVLIVLKNMEIIVLNVLLQVFIINFIELLILIFFFYKKIVLNVCQDINLILMQLIKVEQCVEDSQIIQIIVTLDNI